MSAEVRRGKWRGTDVAIKTFLEQNLSPQVINDFRVEVNIMARLRHPNVVSVVLGVAAT